jgi:PAP2 superfamily
VSPPVPRPLTPGPPPTPPRSPLPPPPGLHATLAGWWRSRYGARLLKEAGVIVALLLLYRLGRMLGRHESGRAFDNARDVLGLENRLGLDTELSLQRASLGHPSLIRLLNRYYASVHFGASMVFLVLVYVRGPKLWTHIRFLFVTVTAAALIIHLLYPLAPPRMLDGYVDTIARYGPAIYDGRSAMGKMANQFAAMPSLHFGWAVLVAYGVVLAFHTRWRWLIVLHPAITLAAIVITANHYWLDALAALALVGAATALQRDRHRRALATPGDSRSRTARPTSAQAARTHVRSAPSQQQSLLKG